MDPRRVLIVSLLVAAGVISCGKDDSPVQPTPPAKTAPMISGVSSTSLVWGDTLVVSGSNFRTPASADTVTFSDPASATPAFAATATSLSVIVPVTAVSGPIKVSHAGGSATGPAVTVAPPPPVVTGVSAATVSPGDMITITGSDFLSPPDANAVTFTNPLGSAIPFDGTATTLSVVVPQDATSGPIAVTHAGGTAGGPSVTVQRGIGDFFVFGGLGASQKLALPNPTATTKYLVIPHATNVSVPYNQELGYDIETEAAIPVAAVNELSSRADRGVGPQELFEAWRWEEARKLVTTRGVPRRPAIRSTDAPAAPQATRQFYVLKTTTGSVTNPSSYQQVTAELRYTGSKCFIYTDQDTLATGNLGLSDLRAIGQAFDNSIDATNVQYFGGYSDVDGNGKVIILITPVVNRLTPGGSGGYIAGFFLSIDLYSPPTVPAGTTNQGEAFYLLAADPAATWGNAHSVTATRDGNISTTAHEHEHMISFSHRLFNEGASFQQTWLEEGMAHMAEDLNGLHDANKGRTAIYLANPGVQSLEDNAAPLSQRGGIYLFLRLMADRYGTGILKQIVQSTCNGRACVQNVTGEDFYDLLPEFLAALYLSGNGITADARFNYTSINLADYGTLGIANRVAGGGLVAGDVRRGTGDFYLFSGSPDTESRFTFNDQVGGGLRNAIVRVQ